ncbi:MULTISPECIES: DUF4437 domain-containing protein [unclassified Mesorhizobium]|uniref:DUF4437 domain-containing protein n=1 Tax=unclassified Mesorhizobium TaxID=325217 RepID=UPI00112CF66F|nr:MULTISPECIES: DUF4437 domain-containing protein [unclassified Mesorhizobium]TPL46983.1 DUF4437 domain-containing protein [Mesorhizobium sp. B2-4-4]TPL51090.1 DUF4437 domain-containing protein [Mesorhizobium sp. B2-4-2]TPM06312.1 DUF4437 domain-containing protein [Mesorhizobium sp. B2-3-8]TPM13691.1 DUF4437 domain-containing protein [Mesorhizobium sp. B2-3-7]TPN05548.1 DUF4437 domain-containing protein [Mesorhizobium sp. B2-1-3]
MPNHLKILTLAAMLTIPGRAFALEDSYLPASKIPYVSEAPDQPQRLGPLWGERAKGPAGTLLKVPGNWHAPVHAHTADYRAVVIQGLWAHWQMDGGEASKVELPPGSYWTQKANEMHADACLSETECVILLINTEPYETYLPK